MTSALMIVDVQQGTFAVSPPIHRGEEIVRRIAGLLARARAEGRPVVHVQHDGGPGDVLGKGSAGWPHHPLVAPRPGEIVVEKRHSSSFHDTDLHQRLTDAGIDRLVIAGMQTEMCVDSACRGAVALGYRVVLVADGHTTWDTPVIDVERIVAHHNRLLGQGFADVVAAADVTF
ncbi:cysteine hydrolase family protein [Reyranella soli]|nr:cysteine hydrolase family protein [Reyranella soli]